MSANLTNNNNSKCEDTKDEAIGDGMTPRGVEIISHEIYKTLMVAAVDVLNIRRMAITVDENSIVVVGPDPLSYKVQLKEDGFYYETLPGLGEHKTEASENDATSLRIMYQPLKDWIEAQFYKDCPDMTNRRLIFNGKELDDTSNIRDLIDLWNDLVAQAGQSDLEISADGLSESPKEYAQFVREFLQARILLNEERRQDNYPCL